LVISYTPQQAKTALDANSNYTSQGTSIEIIPPTETINWVNGVNNMINGINNLVFTKVT